MTPSGRSRRPDKMWIIRLYLTRLFLISQALEESPAERIADMTGMSDIFLIEQTKKVVYSETTFLGGPGLRLAKPGRRNAKAFLRFSVF